MKKEKGQGALRAIGLTLIVFTLLASLTSCGLILGGDGGGGTTLAAPGSTTAPVPPTTQPVDFDQYLSPEIPSEAGTYVYVAAVATPSVVSIVTEEIVYDPYYGSTVASGAGSGVVCYVDTAAGITYIITNNHVVEGYSAVTVYKNGSAVEYPAHVVGTDWQTDIAVISVASTDFVAAQFGNSSQLLVGQEVAAIGNPLGTLGGSVTPGIVGALARQIEIEGVPMTLVQHSAPVSPGNSGGGLFNLYGQLVGIVNAKSTGSGVEGLGYAIPVDLALERAGEIIRQGYVSGTPSLGISYSTSSSGIVVSSYLYNDELSAAGQTTLLAGDILSTLDGQEILEVADVRRVLSEKNVGDTVTAVLYRPERFSYTKYTVTLTVHEYLPSWVED